MSMTWGLSRFGECRMSMTWGLSRPGKCLMSVTWGLPRFGECLISVTRGLSHFGKCLMSMTWGLSRFWQPASSNPAAPLCHQCHLLVEDLTHAGGNVLTHNGEVPGVREQTKHMFLLSPKNW